LFSLAQTAVFRGQDDDAIGRSANVAQDQWQDTLSDAAETHDYDLARKFHMHFVSAHNSDLILICLSFALIPMTPRNAASVPGGARKAQALGACLSIPRGLT
jgi:hypothetical protein